MSSKFCGNCGMALNENAKFCPKCGAVIGHQGGAAYIQVVKPKIPGRGFGISSMVLGIIGLYYSLSLFVSAIELMVLEADEYVTMFGTVSMTMIVTTVIFSILSILPVIFGIAARGRGYKNGISTSGLVMGVIGLVGYILSIVIFAYMTM